MFKLIVAAATAGLAAAQVDVPVDASPARPPVDASPIDAVDPVKPVPILKKCNRYSNVQVIGNTKVDVGRCAGACKSTANPYVPNDVFVGDRKAGARVCKPKHTATQRVRINKIQRCDCVNDELVEPRHELETDQDYENKLTWERRGDSIFVDQEFEFHEDWRKCRRVQKIENVGTDANGNPLQVDVGQCIGQCPVVFQPKELRINLTLTGDDQVQRVFIDGIDKTPTLVNENAWTRGDTVLQTVPRNPGTEHVIAVQVRDTRRSVQGLIATVQYDGAIQHLTGGGDWIATHDSPAAIGGKQWYEPGYDSSSWGLPTLCTVAEANIWGTFWPAAFLADGARWIWGPDSQCRVLGPVPRQAWFLLKFTIPKIPQANCKPTQIAQEIVEVEVVRTCDCQCRYKKECEAPLVWNDNKCQCECGIDASSCPAGTIFNPEKCACENCGICDAKDKEQCLKQQCLYTFYPFSQYQGKPGNCVWRDFNGDGNKECGCPQNMCQRTQSNNKANCQKTVCKENADGEKELCEYNPDQLEGNQCDCAERLA